eukprot:1093459-Rhodomonas_salina.1
MMHHARTKALRRRRSSRLTRGVQEVNLSFNHLYQLPYGVSALTRVTALHLSYNDLTASSLVDAHPASRKFEIHLQYDPERLSATCCWAVSGHDEGLVRAGTHLQPPHRHPAHLRSPHTGPRAIQLASHAGNAPVQVAFSPLDSHSLGPHAVAFAASRRQHVPCGAEPAAPQDVGDDTEVAQDKPAGAVALTFSASVSRVCVLVAHVDEGR